MTTGPRAAVLEICVDSVAGVVAAAGGGADRVELCSALEVGGLTPSHGLTSLALEAAHAASLPLFAMVRPRAGDFAYTCDELALAVAEGRALVDRGVDGLVFGTCAGGEIRQADARRWIDAVRQHAGRAIPCTFHRAIDLVGDPVAAVGIVASLGYDRILTSGGVPRAIDGMATIRAMAARGGDAIVIMAGSGVTADTVAAIAHDTGIAEFHASASGIAPPPEDDLLTFGFATGKRRMTDPAMVRSIRNHLDRTDMRR